MKLEVDVDVCCAIGGMDSESETIVHSRRREGASEGAGRW